MTIFYEALTFAWHYAYALATMAQWEGAGVIHSVPI